MKIAILSDSHDALTRVSKALELARRRGAGLVLHCGDITSPTVVHLFEGWPAHFVFGNCDWEREALAEAIAERLFGKGVWQAPKVRHPLVSTWFSAVELSAPLFIR